jgi:acetylornithine deacetylase
MSEHTTVTEILRQLVGFDTVSADSNLDLIRWVADYLDGYGIVAQLTYDEGCNKANLFATIGPAEAGGGAILSGHTDVVPVPGQPWDSDPFALTERSGRLYGRGTADMKSFIAIALALVPELKSRPLQRPLHLALSFDEEVGCFGAPRLIEALPQGTRRPSLVIVGEPTNMAVANAHKGCHVFATAVTGLEAHSSAPQRGVNAIVAASEIIQFIAGLAGEARNTARPASGFEPPYTSFNIGTISGGTAMNIIPRTCELTWEFRTLPGEDPAAIRARIERDAGIPAVICGPGSIEQGHQPNEFITLDQIAAGTVFQRRLADWACRATP